MDNIVDSERDVRLDGSKRSQRYFEHAVANHWDPYADIDDELLAADRQKLIDRGLSEAEFEEFMLMAAVFGAGEEAVTEDLGPLMLVLDDINDQMFVSSQIFDEAMHTQWFDRYWKEVIQPVADELGMAIPDPTDDAFFNDSFLSLFEKNERAMARLLEENTPETQAKAVCNYHLIIEGVLAQTAYYGLESAFGPEEYSIDNPTLDGLIEGMTYIRADEARHVGFGMDRVQRLLSMGVDESVIHDVMNENYPFIVGILEEFDRLVDGHDLVAYASEKHQHRIDSITGAPEEFPAIDEMIETNT